MKPTNPAPKNSNLARSPMSNRPAAVAVPKVAWNDPSQHTALAVLGGLMLLVLIAYWDMLALTSRVWSEGLYSHGWIIPLCAAGLLWLRWEPIGHVPQYERWAGFALVVLGFAMRLPAAYVGMNPLDRISFLPSVFGIFMMVGGFHIIRAVWPALGFLVFMFPLPTKLEVLVLLRLQTLAATSSTFVLQTLGVAALREQRVISISGIPLFVADACSGLRMVTIFCALAVAMVFLIERPWWDKFIILLSAIPIALVVNIVRITLTGLAYLWSGGTNEFIQKFAHDWAGLFMMPLALGILWLELQILERITIPVDMGRLRPVNPRRGSTMPVR
jgi:exosortase